MINIRYIEKSEELPLGRIQCNIDQCAAQVFDASEFPLRFSIWEDGKKVWHTYLHPNYFAAWDPLQLEGCEAKVTTAHGKLLKTFTPPLDATHTVLYEWASRNEGALGLVIGTHDGTHGEWVIPVKAGQLDVVLVEGSKKTAEICRSNWPNKEVKNAIVSVDGMPTTWYEYGTGEANTIDDEHMAKHVHDDVLVKEQRETVSINTLLAEREYEWLHIDLEGIDDRIIKAMDFTNYKKPKLIIFETINISPGRNNGNQDRLTALFEWLRSVGYEVKYDYWNSFAILIE